MMLQIGQIRSTIFARKVVVMKKIVCMLCALFLVTPVLADTYVNGYYRKDGTYVNGHYRSNADGNRYNNYSTPRKSFFQVLGKPTLFVAGGIGCRILKRH